MRSQQHLFSRDTIRRVNQDMIDRKVVDLSGLPKSVARGIKETRFSRSEIKQAFSEARRRVAEAA